MGGLEPVEVMGTLKKEEHRGEAGCFDSCKRVQCGIEPKWQKGTMRKSKSWLACEYQQAKADVPLPEMQPGSGRESSKSNMEFQEQKELQGAGPAAENILNRSSQGNGLWELGPTEIASVETRPKVDDEAKEVPAHRKEKTSGERRKVPPHLEDLLQRATKGWNQEQQQLIKQLFLDFEDHFSKHDYDIGWTHLIKHKIDTGPTPSFRCTLRSTPKTREEEGLTTLKELEKYKYIQPSTSPWSLPICFVRKPDGWV